MLSAMQSPARRQVMKNTQSVNKALDDPSNVFQAGVATEIELVVAASSWALTDR